jgi:hypothetical protein
MTRLLAQFSPSKNLALRVAGAQCFIVCPMLVLAFIGFPKAMGEDSSRGAVLRHGGALARFLQIRGSRALGL